MSRIRHLLVPALVAVAGSVLVAPSASAAPAPQCNTTNKQFTYVVLYDPGTPELQVDTELRAKCGEKVAYHPAIGVAVATSRNADFQAKIGAFRAYSGGRDVALSSWTSGSSNSSNLVGAKENEETTDTVVADKLSAQQWDMRAIHAPEANKISGGSPSVTVGVLDSGIDPTHPALKNALDPKASAGCTSGAPDTTPAAWAPTTSDHGTHVAGTIAGKDTEHDFTGIAPGVKLASVKVVNDNGLIFPEAAVCGFMWAANHHFAVTNNSYYIDPGMFYCSKEPGDAAAYEAVRRAVVHSTGQGVLNIAAAGNSGFDVTQQTSDPNRPHAVDASCGILPKAIEGVVTVSAIGYSGTKSPYSNFGPGQIEVTAPGGAYYDTPPAGQGASCPLSTVLNGAYGTKCGTSMASPHAAGVAALLASRFPGAPPQKLTRLLEEQADPVPCDTVTAAQACADPAQNKPYYGHGRVNALDAVQ
ncbi:S8 family peptidase [Amycolatopsis sp. RTGN1]|uniref:S8 family peptidase n=1 Tax=Amycolatopsis ponsaeliensis TaxID=2992142 RepID=UPI00254E0C96|nr:S8 family serine peptidase [Amycolatopsis sp. RTGN1]